MEYREEERRSLVSFFMIGYAKVWCMTIPYLTSVLFRERTRGQWPYRPTATRAMRNRHVMLYDLKQPWRSFYLKFEISSIDYPGVHVYIASNGLRGHVSLQMTLEII